MNDAGLSNRAGELIKELDQLKQHVKADRRDETKAKIAIEKSKSEMEQLQARLYVEISADPLVEWESPNPVLDPEGNRMMEFEAQWRTMVMNTEIQKNEDFQKLSETIDKASENYYEAQNRVLQGMTEIGIVKSQLRTIAALLEVSGES